MFEAKSESRSPGAMTYSVSYSDNIYSEDYIGQFLDFTSNYDHPCFSEEHIKPEFMENKKEEIVTS